MTVVVEADPVADDVSGEVAEAVFIVTELAEDSVALAEVLELGDS